jgi:acetate---CoA ligase (ADP-forming)
MRSIRRENLKRLLQPRNIVFIGGRSLAPYIEDCLANGFGGQIWVVNPKYNELGGVKCYPSLDALPAVPDAALVLLPGQAAIETIGHLSTQGVGGALCIAAGFSEKGDEGKALQAELVEAAGEMAVVGPNSAGMINYLDKVVLWMARDTGRHDSGKGVAIISQSGNVGIYACNNRRSLPVSYVISVGNQAVLDASDYIDVLLEDPRVTAIGLYQESISDISAFAKVAYKALKRQIPIVIIKSGRSDLGASIAGSHTGALAGSEDMYDALFERLAVCRVDSVGEFFETLKMLTVGGIPRGNRVAVLTMSGGDGTMVADAVERSGILSLPKPSKAQQATLQELLPGHAAAAGNPLDHNGDYGTDKETLASWYTTMAQENYDVCMSFIDYTQPGLQAGWTEWAYDPFLLGMVDTRQQVDIPCVVASMLPETLPEPQRAILVEGGVAPLQGLNEALAAVGHAIKYGQRRAEVMRQGGSESSQIFRPAALEGDVAPLDEWNSKLLLKQYGIPFPQGSTCTRTNAAEAADKLGYPLVVKALCAELPHKSKYGGVALNLNSAAEVDSAITRMTDALDAAFPNLKIEEFLVERMVPTIAAELIVGIKRDPQFGLALVLGRGGTAVESLAEYRIFLLPLSLAEVKQELLRMPSLEAFRDNDRCIEQVLRAVSGIAEFAQEHSAHLDELDLNPLVICADGEVMAVDALIYGNAGLQAGTV